MYDSIEAVNRVRKYVIIKCRIYLLLRWQMMIRLGLFAKSKKKSNNSLW